MSFLSEKERVIAYFHALEAADTHPERLQQALSAHLAPDYRCRSVYPMRECKTLADTVQQLWLPIKQALSAMQRREDVFIAGQNAYDANEVWVMSMGHYMGLFDHDLLGISPNGKLASLRYAEFHRVKDGLIQESGVFLDLIGLMQQVGENPLPTSLGQYFVYPGPRQHDGIIKHSVDPQESDKTLKLVEKMVNDLSALNDSGSMGCDPELLRRTWHDNMLWYGPSGIGATYTIERYQQQHQLPFRSQLTDKRFEGHVCRFAEGDFACFFGWPNLSNTATGGWLGLPGGQVNASMQVVDVYRRDGDKLSENWVLIDIPYWLKQQGLDVFARNQQLNTQGRAPKQGDS